MHQTDAALACRLFAYWYESDDEFLKVHSSAKLSKLSRSVCT